MYAPSFNSLMADYVTHEVRKFSQGGGRMLSQQSAEPIFPQCG
jgi:hypothetical protein